MFDYNNLIKTIVQPLVDDTYNSLEVKVMPVYDDKTLEIFVMAHEDVIARLIGKEGKVANAIRSLVKSCAYKENLKVLLEFEAY
jgi:uncharacterized protein